MSESVLATWEVTTKTSVTNVIVPDGCQDLIIDSSEGEKPRFFVSPLFDTTQTVTLRSGTMMAGFRIRPGTRVDEEKLLATISSACFDPYSHDEIGEYIDTFSTRDNGIEEVLYSLASGVKTVTRAAKEIGVTTRTLQRLVLRETGRSPVYWMMLARVRKAARALNSTLHLVDIAELYGYADQAHMTREFKRWFNASPAVLRSRPAISNQLYEEAYDGVDTGVHSSTKTPFLSET